MPQPAPRSGEPPPLRDDAAGMPRWLPALGLVALFGGTGTLLWQAGPPAPAEAPRDQATQSTPDDTPDRADEPDVETSSPEAEPDAGPEEAGPAPPGE